MRKEKTAFEGFFGKKEEESDDSVESGGKEQYKKEKLERIKKVKMKGEKLKRQRIAEIEAKVLAFKNTRNQENRIFQRELELFRKKVKNYPKQKFNSFLPLHPKYLEGPNFKDTYIPYGEQSKKDLLLSHSKTLEKFKQSSKDQNTDKAALNLVHSIRKARVRNLMLKEADLRSPVNLDLEESLSLSSQF